MKTFLTSILVVLAALLLAAQGFVAGGGAPTGFTFDSDDNGPAPGMMYQNNSAAATYELDSSIASVELDPANNWFWEVRVKTISHVSANGGGVIVTAWGNDEHNVVFFPTQVNIHDDNWPGTPLISVPVASGAFHTVRVEHAAGGGTQLRAFVDGVDEGLFNATDTSQLRFRFGGLQSGGEAVWDHVVINQEIPEPSTLALLASGLLGLLCYAWRKRR